MDTLEAPATTSASQSVFSTNEVERACCASAPELTPDATRLRILELLAQQPVALCVCEITDQFTLHQPAISHHLHFLREAGLIAGENRGTWSNYWATEEGKRGLASVESLV